jgi:hypothetical protein
MMVWNPPHATCEMRSMDGGETEGTRPHPTTLLCACDALAMKPREMTADRKT